MTNTAVRQPRSSSRTASHPAEPHPVGSGPAGSGMAGSVLADPVRAATGTSGSAWPSRARVGEVAAAVASVLGLGSAAVSLGWGLGGTLLLDTVGGGAIEQVAPAGTPLALVAVVAVVALKVVAALLPGWALSPDGSAVYPSARRRVVRGLAWCEAVVLTGYGAVMTVGGLLVMTGVVAAAPGADTRAIAWNAFLWDPWLLAWGLAASVALLATRRRVRR